MRDSETAKIYYGARENADHEIKAYEEFGNTAYITFDHFHLAGWAGDYYEGNIETEDDPASPTMDTIALIMYAHRQITREDSPIENVVIDLSLNGGGEIDAGAFTAAWYLGEASMSVRSSMTGAISTGTYRVDTNLDGVFDEKDTVQDKNLYCLIGPYSFSCGNLVPNIFRSSGRVTLLGKQSGGGSCSVLGMSTAHGSLFNISSPKRMSYMKNGSYYDTDTGIQPDCIIVKPEHFYDREALTDYINRLF
jgi:C-terminal processing protease CtpA/Prc